VEQCRKDAALPEPLAAIGATIQSNLTCLSKTGGTQATYAVKPGTVSEDLNFFNSNYSFMKPVVDKYATRAELEAKAKADKVVAKAAAKAAKEK
jgi:hypothetical protein